MKTLYVNGRVFTGQLPLQEAFAVENGLFCAVGSNHDILALRAADDAVVDLKGRFVCPGFIDSHMHLLNYGSAMTRCDLTVCTDSIASLQRGLREFLATHELAPGAWLGGRGWNQDYFTTGEGMPTRQDLDAVADDRPIVIVRCCGHCMVVNTYTLRLLGIDGTQPQPDGGHYDVDETGYPTGVFRDTAMSMIYPQIPAPTRAELKSMLLAAAAALNSYGVTSCHTDDLCAFENVPWTEVIAAYDELVAENALTVRVYEQSQFTTVSGLQEFLDAGYNTGVGTDMFRIGPLKLLGDGSLGARTAYLSSDYADAPGERGLAIFTQDEFDALIGLAHKSGMQVAIHAIGDGILDRILDAYEKAFDAHPRADHRSGIVHVQITRPDQLERMRQMNLHAYIQSIFIDYDARIVRARVGERADTSYAFHSMKASGMHVSNGTDCPVEFPNAMRGIECAVTRTPVDGSCPAYRPEEAMSVEEALQSYTSESAHASFEENVKGKIQPGMLADFTVLSADPFAVPVHELHTIVALETYLGGTQVYARM